MFNSEEKKVNDILQDLYQIDSEFKKNEAQLRELIHALLLTKPDTHFDQVFALKLRNELIGKKKSVLSPYGHIFMHRLMYGVTGGILTLLIIVPLAFFANKSSSFLKPLLYREVKNANTSVALTPQISEKGQSAFGPLALDATVKTSEAASAQNSRMSLKVAPTADEESTSTPLAVIPTQASPAALSLAATATDESTVPVSTTNVAFKYVYEGESLNLTDEQGTVLKRTMGSESSKQLSSLIKGAKFNIADIASFSNLNVKNIDLVENKKEGYLVSINVDAGYISISKNPAKWTASTATTTPEVSKDDVIAVANAFLKDHGIDSSLYGTPVIEDHSTTAVYPILLNGKEVYDQNGASYGMSITIDPQDKKVASLDNLTSQIYESSKYPLETASSSILSVIESFNTPVKDKNTTIKKIVLDTPKQIFMRYMSFDAAADTTTELYVPALLFPIKNPNTPAQGPQFILIPLVKDFLAKGKGNTFVPHTMLASPEAALKKSE